MMLTLSKIIVAAGWFILPGSIGDPNPDIRCGGVIAVVEWQSDGYKNTKHFCLMRYGEEPTKFEEENYGMD